MSNSNWINATWQLYYIIICHLHKFCHGTNAVNALKALSQIMTIASYAANIKEVAIIITEDAQSLAKKDYMLSLVMFDTFGCTYLYTL